MLPRRRALAFACVAALLAACDSPPGDSADDTVNRTLVGRWLRDYEEAGVHARRLLVLESDGRFTEQVRVVDAAGGVTEHSHAGNWLWDGTNLKRKYTSFDGKPPSAPTMPWATFALRFESPREFVGTDNVRRREVRYRRVDAFTEP